MFKLGLKLLISLVLLTLLGVKSQNVATTPQNVIVTIKDYLKPQILSAINRDNQSDPAKNSGKAGADFFSSPRSKTSSTVRDLFSCAIALDAPCVVDRAEDIVDNANSNLLRQADIEARGLTSKKEESPSNLLSVITKMLMEIPELVRETFYAFMREGKLEVRAAEEESGEESSDEEDSIEDDEDETSEEEEDDDDESEDEDDEDKEGKDDSEDASGEDGLEAKIGDSWGYNTRRRCPHRGNCMQNNGGEDSSTGVSAGGNDEMNDSYGSAGRKDGGTSGDGRGKKKKKKKAIVKLLLIGLILKAKITLLLKILAAKLQVKFLLIALANLLLNLARFWWDLKKGHGEQPQKVIYYEHAQHQHHYDGAEDWHGSSGPGGGGGYWARTYDNEDDQKSAQDIAYSKYAPHGTTYSRIDDKPNISWNPSDKSYI